MSKICPRFAPQMRGSPKASMRTAKKTIRTLEWRTLYPFGCHCFIIRWVDQLDRCLETHYLSSIQTEPAVGPNPLVLQRCDRRAKFLLIHRFRRQSRERCFYSLSRLVLKKLYQPLVHRKPRLCYHAMCLPISIFHSFNFLADC